MQEWTYLQDTKTGVLGLTQLPLRQPQVPKVIELQGDHLDWSNPSASEPCGHTEIFPFPGGKADVSPAKNVPVYDGASSVEVDATGALDRFTRLRTGDDVLRFARRYGVFEFCEHGLPATHNPRFLSVPLLGLIGSPSLWEPVEVGAARDPSFLIRDKGERPWCEPVGREAIQDWLFWSRTAASILNVAAALNTNNPTKSSDWETIITQPIEEKPLLIRCLVSRRWVAQIYLQEAVNLWLHLANVRLSMSWPYGVGKAKLELESSTFGVLGVQLLAAVTGAQTLAICDGCSAPYVRSGRRPQIGRANYCLDCRERKVPDRIRQRRRRAKAAQSGSPRLEKR